MECPRCGFHSLPGSPACVQCRADLAATALPKPEDFYPARRPAHLRAGSVRHRVRRGEEPDLVGAARGSVSSAGARQAMLCSLVPGFGQRRNGEPRKAWLHLCVAAVLVLLNLLLWTTRASPPLVALLLAFVAYGMTDAFAVALSLTTGRPVRELGGAVAGASLMSAGIVGGLASFAWLAAVGTLFERAAVNISVGDLRAGDQVLVQRVGLDDLRAGDLVLATFAERRVHLHGTEVPAAFRGGAYPELVVGLEGERIVVSEGRVTVNGRDVPVVVGLWGDDAVLDVPENRCVTARTLVDARGRAVLLELSPEALRGRIWAVSWPPERRRIVRGWE